MPSTTRRSQLRPRTRRIARHGLLAVACAIAGWLVTVALAPSNRLFQLSMASAYVGLTLWAATLLLGPWNVLRRAPNPVSTYVRRDVAIWAGLVSLFHVAVGLQRHMSGRFWQYFVFPDGHGPLLGLRYDAFGLTNWLGLAATLVLLVLLALSNDAALRTLGKRRWKFLQRWSYPAFAAVILHGFAFQLIENRAVAWIVVVGLVLVVVLVGQLAGFRRVASPD